MAWMTLADFKSQTGITTMSDALIQQALDAGAAMMKRYIFYKDWYRSTTQKTQHILSGSIPSTPRRIYIADDNMDGTITVADVYAYEIDPNFIEYPLNGSVTSFNSKYGVLNFATNVPTANDRIFMVEFKHQITDIDTILPMLMELNQIEAVNYLFQKVPFAKLQSGISSWNLNGVSVTFDMNVMNQIIESNLARAKKLYNVLIPLYAVRSTLQAPQRQPLTNYLTTLTFRSWSP